MNLMLMRPLLTALSRMVLAVALLASGLRMVAQPIENAVFTLGTTTTDAQNRTWGYVVLSPTDPSLLKNRQLAVFSKTGDPSAPTAFTRQSIIGLQTEPATIQALLNRAATVGDKLDDLENRLNNLFAGVMPSTNLTLAEKLSIVIRGSVAEPQNFGSLVLLGRLHPSVNLCLGLGHLQQLTNGPLTTFEVRSFDSGTGQAGGVVGRVTVTNSAPLILPAPGLPIMVPEKGAMGQLNVRLRWATSPELRRVALLSAGFDVFRVPEAVAIASGYVANPPKISQLLGNPATVRVNTQPVFKNRDYDSDAQAADLVADPKTFFVADDNGLSRVTPPTLAHPFKNGDKFYYYVAGRDLLGREGVVSPGVLVTVCDRVPTDAPHLPTVDNAYQYVGVIEQQQLRVTWKPVTNVVDGKQVTGYYVYRWDSPRQAQELGSNPLAHRISPLISHVPGKASYQFTDTGFGAPSAPADFGKTFWYTVRAVDDGACDGGNYSPGSAAAFGVLRDRNGPDAPQGTPLVMCCRPGVVAEKPGIVKPDSENLDPALDYFEAVCLRADSRIAWAEFTATRAGISTNFLGRVHFPANSSQAVRRFTFDRATFSQGSLLVTCQVGSSDGQISGQAKEFTEVVPSRGLISQLPFAALMNCVQAPVSDGNLTGDFRCRSHSTQSPQPDGTVTNNGIDVVLELTPGTKEFKLYRRVDFGPLTLIQQGDGDYDAATNALHQIIAHDGAMPANSATLCYYAQLFDENGNSSPMAQIGSCLETQMPVATPLLAPLAPLGDDANPQMDIRWFCPPVGIQRFRVEVAVDNGFPPATLGTIVSSDQISVHPNWLSVGPSSTNQLDFAEYLTPAPGADFGPGPEFELIVPIQLGVKYTVQIVALDKGGAVGTSSHAETFKWAAPAAATGPHVPWPARPLGPVGSLPPKIIAQRLTNGFYDGMAIRIGSIARTQLFSGSGMDGKAPRASVKAGVQPTDLIFTNDQGQSLLPFVVYRYQVANAAYPKPAGDLIQVSPLMETLAMVDAVNPNQILYQKLVDPFVIAPTVIGNTDVGVVPIYLLDTQPAVRNASYAYLLVRFGPNSEPLEVLPVTAALAQP
jgi:hypothetical protein